MKEVTKDHIYEKSRISKSIEAERSLVVAQSRARGKWTVIANRFGVSLWDNENILKLGCGDGCKTL